MTKIIFVLALATTSIASACKVSQAGLSFNLISATTQLAFSSMDSNEVIKAVYKDASFDGYIVETLDQNKQCTAQLYDAQFDTLNCKTNVTPVATFVEIPCK